jgi:hypothetical protein
MSTCHSERLVSSQIANIMPNVYGFGDVATALLVSLAGLLSIVASLAGGAWLARSTPMTVYFGGVFMRFAGALGLALVGMLAGSALILAAAFMMTLYMGVPVARLAQGPIGYRLAIVQAGEEAGQWVIKPLDSGGQAFSVTSDDDGALWLIVGTDSGFEGLTALYYSQITASLTVAGSE